ncbi:MAG: 3-isopropylmalate dehydratase large subunit [Paracoccus sp. (in: a-proteobacteria)]
MAQTLFDRIWNEHRISTLPNGADLIHIDRHILHDVTSPIAFAQLRETGHPVRNPELTFATIDHIISTRPGRNAGSYAPGKKFVEALRRETAANGIRLFDLDSGDQGIVHVISPDLGIALPGMSIVCGDSHTCTVGGLGAMAFGIGSSDIEQVLATQCLMMMRPKTMRIRIDGQLGRGVTAKDVILAVIARTGARGGVGHAVEFAGSTIRAMTIEERLTICNMAIEFGARIGMIAPDDTVFDYLSGRRFAPKGENFNRAVSRWRGLASDEGAQFDAEISIDAADIAPTVTWGTSPDQAISITSTIPDPSGIADETARNSARVALDYMGLKPGTRMEDIAVDQVFIGSCTNGRLSDLRAAAAILKGHRVASGLSAIVVPGSEKVKAAAEAEGLDRIFADAGFEWREPGCSMCCALQDDRLAPGKRCASTSNRNFEGRQGPGGRTHLMSPAMAAAAAITGRITDVRKLEA